MSFALTTNQVRAKQKTVTRRLGWKGLKTGSVVQPVVKAQGLKKGEKVQRIGSPIRIVSVRREPLTAITGMDVMREGFPAMTPHDFIDMFCQRNGGESRQVVTRIEFEYTAGVVPSPQEPKP